jgi:hypothetical protein
MEKKRFWRNLGKECVLQNDWMDMGCDGGWEER